MTKTIECTVTGLCLLSLLILSGCASPPKLVREAQTAPAHIPSVAHIKSFQLSGRVAVKFDGQGFSGNLSWQHAVQQDDILILSPLGQGVAQIKQNSSGVVLTTADQQQYQAQDAETLTESVLGWRLPLTGMRYWILGQAAPGIAEIRLDELKRPMQLEQDGWQIDYLGFREVDGLTLPQKMTMHRQSLEMKLVIDDWLID